MPSNAPPRSGHPPEPSDTDPVDDGQEEVSSRHAIERGLVEDPTALPPSPDHSVPRDGDNAGAGAPRTPRTPGR